MFTAYLRGIETTILPPNKIRVVQFTAYLRGIETKKVLISEVFSK